MRKLGWLAALLAGIAASCGVQAPLGDKAELERQIVSQGLAQSRLENRLEEFKRTQEEQLRTLRELQGANASISAQVSRLTESQNAVARQAADLAARTQALEDEEDDEDEDDDEDDAPAAAPTPKAPARR